MKKRLFSLVLALILSAGTAAAVSAAEAETVKQYSISEVGIKTDALVNMYDGITRVWVDGKVGFIDENGNTVTAPKYDYATDMIDGVAVVGYALPETFTYTNQETGEEVVRTTYDLYVVTADGTEKQLLVDPNASGVSGAAKIYSSARELTADGLLPVQHASDSEDAILIKNGVIYADTFLFRYDGTPIYVNNIEELYLENQGSAVNLLLYMTETGACEDGVIPMWVRYQPLDVPEVAFYIDLDGNILKEFEPYEYHGTKSGILRAWQPEDGYSVVYVTDENSYYGGGSNWGCGVIDSEGEYVIAPEYANFYFNQYRSINEGKVTLKNRDGKWGVMNIEGEVVVPFEYDRLQVFNQGFVIGMIGEEYAVIDENGNKVDIVDESGKVIDNITGITPIYDNGVFEVTTTETYVYTGGSVSPWASMHFSSNAPTTVTETKYYLVDTVLEDGVLTAIEGADDYCIIGTGDGEYWEYIDWTTGTLGYIKVNVEEVAAEAEEECNYPVTWSPLWKMVTGGALIG